MEGCSVCGSAEEPILFDCDGCDRSFCSDHRLPENHDCPGHNFVDDPLTGQGPDTRDRRSTRQKRTERVRQKRTEKWMKKASDIDLEEDNRDLNPKQLKRCNRCQSIVEGADTENAEVLCSECSETTAGSQDGGPESAIQSFEGHRYGPESGDQSSESSGRAGSSHRKLLAALGMVILSLILVAAIVVISG